MLADQIINKLTILAESAKYDVSCSSSGAKRKKNPEEIGSTAFSGICHTYTEDGRCVSLLKIMLTNYCIYDCAYCISRKSNDIKRASFSIKELVELTLEFYRRNYIEGLFLSSGIIKNPDHTMERMIRVVRQLREVHKYNGYIHLKAIPGASRELILQAGLYADRMSVNLEIPTEKNLKILAPDKNHESIFRPMAHIQNALVQYKEEKKRFINAPKFAAAGQSTQMIIGATNETDSEILKISSFLYRQSSMKRVYYSGFIPVNSYDTRLPTLIQAPLIRENRLYQADWLMRFYQFKVDEILDSSSPNLDLDFDPKLAWAFRHPEFFPINVNTADYHQILRVPGIGVKSARIIISSRKFGFLDSYQLKKIGVNYKRAQYFIECKGGVSFTINEAKPENLRKHLLQNKKNNLNNQLSIFFPE